MDAALIDNKSSNAVDTQSKDGYDMPVYGIENGSFYYVHVPAIVFIVTSFTCALIAIICYFRNQDYKSFFTRWTKAERLIVYLSTCDVLFSLSHLMDHLHMVIARDHVRPKQLCSFYGFNLVVFVAAQILIVNVVAFNAFMMMYFHKNMHFGNRDWKLFLWTFVTHFVASIVAANFGQFGPNGTAVLYILTFAKIKQEVRTIEKGLGAQSASRKAPIRAARTMSMFVLALAFQWWAVAVHGVWRMFTESDEDIPKIMYHFTTTFSNTGGILNLVIYMFIRKKKLGSRDATESHYKFSSHAVDKNCKDVAAIAHATTKL
ncbi:hypothetical protein MAR_034785 [Mya arenaria]|uniref:G-protein coupled receptors family 1 profile domain-containing protein n=1 Tax=Mya arenaria TaxID=6604 RepID=A0ABY7EMT4_MYAAR|nr:hypothetical protein MAR_034785 [Mya arenaria]